MGLDVLKELKHEDFNWPAKPRGGLKILLQILKNRTLYYGNEVGVIRQRTYSIFPSPIRRQTKTLIEN